MAVGGAGRDHKEVWKIIPAELVSWRTGYYLEPEIVSGCVGGMAPEHQGV